MRDKLHKAVIRSEVRAGCHSIEPIAKLGVREQAMHDPEIR
jgi:hypothetical protein